MPLFLYPTGFLLSLIGLSLWTYQKDNDRLRPIFRNVFILGMVLYLSTLLTVDMALDKKVLAIFRDFVVMAVVNWVLTRIMTKKSLFLPALIGLSVLFLSVGYKPMMQRLSSNSVELSDIAMAPDGEWLVELQPNTDYQELAIQLKGLATVREAFEPIDLNSTTLDDYIVVDIKGTSNAEFEKVRRILKKNRQVKHVEENEVIQLGPPILSENVRAQKGSILVNDPDTEKQWGLDVLQMNQYYQFLRKWKLSPKKKVLLAILDTGVDADHEDLKSTYKSTEKKSDTDPVGHGTHCAGIAGAVTNNNIGIASYDIGQKYYQITSIKVLNANGMGTQETIIDGIIKAADANASVISMSLGGRTGTRKQRAYEKAVKYANKKGAIVVVAAGNENRNAKDITPANVKGVITVSAVDSTLTRALFSNHISDLEMGIAAPGVGIYSTIPGNQYTSYNGTSMATPFVAGLVAMMKSFKPQLTTQEAYDILSETGIETRNPKQTGAFIQPSKALEALLAKK